MRNINIEKRKKANKIYNQCLIYAIIAGALSVPFLLPTQDKVLKTAQTSQPVQNQNPKPVQTAIVIRPELHNTTVMATAMVVEKPAPASPPVILKAEKTDTFSSRSPKIDSQFIARMEGSVLKGYVPLPGRTKSGVTVANGFDLGQMHVQEFNQLPFSAVLKNKLRPYVGLKKYNAVAFLKSHPLSISQAELLEINQVAMDKILQPLMKNYNKASKTPFTSLPKQAQTALFSFAYQYGPDFMKKPSGSKLWHYFVTQDWKKVSATLRGSRQYASRRHQEAELINNLAYKKD
jgi:Bacterial toxin homologue of phage lysozyme, C-term